MNQKLRGAGVLFLCLLLTLNGAGGAAAREEEEYVRLSDTLEVRRELFDIVSPAELAVYRVRRAEGDIDLAAQYFQFPAETRSENPFSKSYIRNGELLLSMGEGAIYLSRDGASSSQVQNRYTHPNYDGLPMVWPEELPGWEKELSYMSRAEAARTVREALNTLYELEPFEQCLEVYAVASSGNEPDCYLVDVDFRLSGVSVTPTWRMLFSGWESYGMHVNAVVDERGIRSLASEYKIYIVEEAGEAVPVLDFRAAMEIYRRSCGDLLMNDRIQVRQAQLLYIPMPVPGRRNAGQIEMRPVWCFRTTYAKEEGWRRWYYIDACTGVEYDM